MTAVGIDLGTSNTVVACSRGTQVRVLGDESGKRLLPSVVSFHPNGDVLVGAPAKQRRVIDPRNTIANHKRLLGHSWHSPEMIEARKRSAFELREGPGQGALVHTRGQDYTLPEISAFILKRARKLAEMALGERIERAVITVPAHFNELQRSATKVAGRVSGIEVMRILNEPTAAALAYGLGRSGRERVAVYDFGGGTFDCTLLDLNGNVYEVLATAGDSFLGGDDADTLVADRIADHLLATHRFDARADAPSFERLKVAGEELKIALSEREVARTQLDDVSFGVGGAPLNVVFDLSRREFETMVGQLVERTLDVTREALTLARLRPDSFDKIILVGGSTRMPLVKRRVEEFFKRKPLDNLNPDEVVAAGAAIQAGALTDGSRRRDIPAAPLPAGRSKTFEGVDQASLARPNIRTMPPGAALEDTPPTDAPKTSAGFSHTVPLQPRTPPVDPRSEVDEPGFGDLAVPAPFEWENDATQAKPGAPPPHRTAPIAVKAPPLAPRPGPMVARPAVPHDPAEDSWVSRTQPAGPAHVPPAPPPRAPFARTAPMSAPPAPQAVSGQMPPPVPPMRPAIDSTPSLSGFFDASALPLPGGLLQVPAGAPVLVDVTPRALVVETAGGYVDTVIPRNAKIPCERTRNFTTGIDHQTEVRVRVAQGEDPRFGGNTFLGEVLLSGLRPAIRGEVMIAVTFEMDADGTLQVRARDTVTKQEARTQIQLIGTPDESTVARLIDRFAARR